MDESLKKIFSYVDAHKKDYIATLKEAVAIKSVSAWAESRGDVEKMIQWAKKRLEDLGSITLPDGRQIPLPSVLFGQLGKDPSKKTVCIYGHLDVQPALKEDGWDTEPFELVEKDGKLYGRGASDDKGPVIGWIHAVEAYQKTGNDIPVNLK
ncbi:Septin-4, partial [Armadillidium vulgare]